MDERTLSVRDGMFQTSLHQAGAGDPLLFLHGSPGLRQGPYLDQLAQRFTIYAPLHPGVGESTGLDHIDDVVDLALYYYDLMDELGLESAHVVGHSLGGMLAAEMAALCPHRVRRLVLTNPVGLWRDEEPVLDFFTLSADQLLPYMVHDVDAEPVRQAFARPEATDEIVEAMFQRMQALTAAGKFLWPIPDKGLKRRIHRIQAPALILWGESDRLVPPSYAEDFHSRIRSSQVVILKECGHLPMIEKPDEWCSAVTEFLQG